MNLNEFNEVVLIDEAPKEQPPETPVIETPVIETPEIEQIEQPKPKENNTNYLLWLMAGLLLIVLVYVLYNYMNKDE